MSSKLVSYEYDDLGRLVRVIFPDGASAVYAYDAAGNRTSVTETPPGPPPSPTPITVTALPKKYCGDLLNNAMVVQLSDGSLLGWGDNTQGVLANGIVGATNQPPQRICFDPNTPAPPFNATIVDWALTNANLYVVFSNGWVYSCGQNAYGQTGHGEASTVVRPYLKRIEHFIKEGKKVVKVWAAGARATTNGGGCVYFQTADDIMYGCGNNVAGNLGLPAPNETSNQNTPMRCNISGHVVDVVIICASTVFSCYMRTENKRLLVAGDNTYGQLGIYWHEIPGQTPPTVFAGRFRPAQAWSETSGGDFEWDIFDCEEICADAGWDGTTGSAVAFYRDTNGGIWRTSSPFWEFRPIPSLENNIVKAEPGGGKSSYAYAIKSDGTFYTWGYNGQNNLFHNNTTTQSNPTIASAVPDPVSKAFFPKGNYLVSDAQLFVFTTTRKLAYAGVANGQAGIANTANPGAYFYIPLPKQITDGTEEIVDIFVHGSGIAQRLFVLTDIGNLYSCGDNADSIGTGGIASNVNPTKTTFFKIRVRQT